MNLAFGKNGLKTFDIQFQSNKFIQTTFYSQKVKTMIISLQLDSGKQENFKIRKLFDEKIIEKIRPRMVEKPKPKPKKEIKTSYSVDTENVIPIFLDWLESNVSKFRYRPYVNSITEDSVEVFFQGISSNTLSAQLYQKSRGYAGFRIAAKRNGVFYDWLLDVDIVLMRDRNGYYCKFCSPREYFENEESIVKQHLLDGVLKWCNEHLDRAEGVSFSRNSGRWIYSVSLVSKDDSLEKINPDQYVAF
jgi:hypothetical protein